MTDLIAGHDICVAGRHDNRSTPGRAGPGGGRPVNPARVPGEGVAMSGDVSREPRVPDDASVPSGDANDWWIYRGAGGVSATPLADLLPPPPPWRDFDGGPVIPGPAPRDDAEIHRRLGAFDAAVRTSSDEADMVNAALFLRRPLIVTGPPGIGKSSLAHRVSRELDLGRVLRWTITSRSTLKEGLYAYDAIGRVQEAAALGALHGPAATEGRLSDKAPAADGSPRADGADSLQGLGDFVQLGPLGTALVPRDTPRVLLIDEFDKADTDLANDLLGAFEDGEFHIPELSRVRSRMPEVTVHTDDPDDTFVVRSGRIRCRAFPFVVITSNGERSLPPAFLRRCLTLEMPPPDADRLMAMLAAQFTSGEGSERATMIRDFLSRALAGGTLAADQLLNAEFLRVSPKGPDEASWNRLLHSLWRRLDEVGSA
ncbi:AAA family ATPase [Streptomyces sp. NPDC059680]|uniref:AAA family ATPase n=1 Tax=Streptomyces TaxID=1883 RepID=UPI001E5CABE7|nr:MoxR family ATPase [Streptomyces barringtoniae]MCC5473967.1 MoxR family ATPase [Streptomyces barringtoniae]